MAYNEYKTDQQSNLNWGESFKMAVKAPAIADRVFETWQDADDYVKDPNASAVAGITISVINDTGFDSDGNTLNGLYYVNVTPGEGGGVLVDWMGNPILQLIRQGAVQSDWECDDESSMSYIRNRPNSDYGNYTVEETE